MAHHDIHVPLADIQAQQVLQLYSTTPLTLAGTLALAATVRVLLSDQASISYELNLFMFGVIILVAIRFITYLFWIKSMAPSSVHWAYIECFLAFMLAMVWNHLIWAVFAIEDPIAIANLIVIMVGMLAAAIVTQAVYLPAYFSLGLPMMLFASFSVAILREDSLHLMIFGLLYTIMCIGFLLIINRNRIGGIEQTLRNERLLEALDIERQRVVEADQAKSEFFAAASHDLRQPIHALSLFLGALNPSPDQSFVVRRMNNAVTGLQQLYDRVLDISKLQSGTVEPAISEFDLAALISDALDKHYVAASSKGIQLNQNLDSTWVASDEVLLMRIVDNLISNAIRYTEKGGVTVSLRNQGNRAVIAIQDTGVGVPAEQLQQIFEPYTQLSNRPDSPERGFGLGLSIVKNLADLLGCGIETSSTVGEGTTFVVSLQQIDPAPQPQKSPTTPISVSDALHVFVIDDDPSIQEATRILLESWHYQVSIIESLQQIKQAANPDLVITDYQLWENHTGFDVINELRQSGKSSPVIMLTGDSDPGIRSRCEEQNLPLLIKPLKPAQLRAAIHRVCGHTGVN